MESARFTLFTRKTKSPKIMALPPTSPNLMLHLLRAHLQVMLWKVADHQTPPDDECSNITNFGWKIVDGIPVPVTGTSDSAPQSLYMLFGVSVRHKTRSAVHGPVDATENISHVQHVVNVMEKMADAIHAPSAKKWKMLRWRLSNLNENLRRM